MTDKKQRIITLLKKERKPLSTSKIAVKIKSNQWMAEKYLEALEEEKKIIKIKQLNSTYWELTSKTQIQRRKKTNERN